MAGALADAAAVFAWLTHDLGHSIEDVVLYGQSVGSGPTSALAAAGAPGAHVSGVVLHSPIASGVRTLKPGWTWWPPALDIFPNDRLLPRVAAPVLVMHGTADEVVSFACGAALADAARRPSAGGPLWEKGGGHCDLELAPEYIPRLRAFLAEAATHRDVLRAGGPSTPLPRPRWAWGKARAGGKGMGVKGEGKR